MSDFSWSALAETLGLTAKDGWAEGAIGAYPTAVTSRQEATWAGLVVGNPASDAWTLTRRWEPQARNPRRPDDRTVRFRDIRLTERYVGVAETPDWFRSDLSTEAIDALVDAADKNRLGSCSIELRGHLLYAKFRSQVVDVPDLPETMASLHALACCLDGDAPALPDPGVEPLAPLARPKDRVTARRVRADSELLTFELSKAPGLLSRFQPAPQILIDWEKQMINRPDLDLPLGTIRQVIVAQKPDNLEIEFVDKAGACALAVYVEDSTSLSTLISMGADPPVVYVDTGSQ